MNSTVMDDRLFERQVAALEAIAGHMDNLVFEVSACRVRVEALAEGPRRVGSSTEHA